LCLRSIILALESGNLEEVGICYGEGGRNSVLSTTIGSGLQERRWWEVDSLEGLVKSLDWESRESR
jgi:hypothetical protein